MKMLYKSLAALLLVSGGATALNAAPGSKDADKVVDGKSDKKKEEPKDLSIADIKVQAEASTNAVKEDVKQGARLRLKAKKSNDPSYIPCVNDNILKLEAQANLFEKAAADVGDALAVVNADKGNAALSSANKIAAKIHNLREAAEACMTPKEMFYQGESQVEFNGVKTDDPDGARGDQTESPGFASPYGA
jgi:hypothetical protein